MFGIFCMSKRKQSLMYISHLFEGVCSGAFGVGLVSFIKILYIKSLNCLIKDNICLSSSPGPSMHKWSGKIHSLTGKMHFPSDKLLWFSLLLHTNAGDIWTVLCEVFTPCSLPIVSRMNFPFPPWVCGIPAMLSEHNRKCPSTKRYVLTISQIQLLGSWKPDRAHLIWCTHSVTPEHLMVLSDLMRIARSLSAL